jgi:predicted nucleic acid-binding protein
MLTFEISGIPSESNREHILGFVDGFSDYFIGHEREKEAILLTNEIMETGIRRKDASHLACSIIAECDYFITTDNRVLKFKTDKIQAINPVDFVKKWREQND